MLGGHEGNWKTNKGGCTHQQLVCVATLRTVRVLRCGAICGGCVHQCGHAVTRNAPATRLARALKRRTLVMR